MSSVLLSIYHAQHDWLQRHPDASPELAEAHKAWLCAERGATYPMPAAEYAILRKQAQEADKRAQEADKRAQEAFCRYQALRAQQVREDPNFPFRPGLRVVWPNARESR